MNDDKKIRSSTPATVHFTAVSNVPTLQQYRPAGGFFISIFGDTYFIFDNSFNDGKIFTQLIFTKMKKLLQLYKPLSLVEIFLVAGILLHVAIFGPKQYFIDMMGFLTFLVHVIISWKIMALTNKNFKAGENLVIVGYIVSFIKIIVQLLLLVIVIVIYSRTNRFITINNERGLWYYSFFLSFLFFFFISPVTFITYFGIVKENRKNANRIIHLIGSSTD